MPFSIAIQAHNNLQLTNAPYKSYKGFNIPNLLGWMFNNVDFTENIWLWGNWLLWVLFMFIFMNAECSDNVPLGDQIL
jgi:hypothetical protein